MAVSKDGLQYRFVIPGASAAVKASSVHGMRVSRDHGTKQPTSDVCRSAAIGPKPDITQTAQVGRE